MTADAGPILVIGATGQQGGAAARHLLDVGRRVRAFVRDPAAPAASALRAAGAELAVGDLDVPESVRLAMDGASGVFLALTMMAGRRISPEGVAAEQRRGTAVVETAHRSGIRHLVYSSISGADAGTGIPYYESKAHIEERIEALGLPATILRPVSFMDNFATYNRPVLRDGELVVNLAVRPDRPTALVAVRDIGAFAAIAFARPADFIGRRLDIAGDAVAPTEIAQTFASVCGVPARFRRTPIELVRAADEQLAKMFVYFDEHPAAPPDLEALRAYHPGLMRLETWLRTTGWPRIARNG